MLENEESDRSKKRDMDVPDEKRISARCTASSQERHFRVTTENPFARFRTKWTKHEAKNRCHNGKDDSFKDHHPEKQQPTNSLDAFLGLGDTLALSHSRTSCWRGNQAFWRCLHVGGGLRRSHLSNHLLILWLRMGHLLGDRRSCLCLFFGCFCQFLRGCMSGTHHLYGWHGCPGDSLLKGEIRVVPSSDVGNVRGGVRMTGERHPLGAGDVGVVGNHPQSQLTPAVISKKMAVFDLRFFVQLLAKLRGENVMRLDKILRQKVMIWHAYITFAMAFFPIRRVGFIWNPQHSGRLAYCSRSCSLAL